MSSCARNGIWLPRSQRAASLEKYGPQIHPHNLFAFIVVKGIARILFSSSTSPRNVSFKLFPGSDIWWDLILWTGYLPRQPCKGANWVRSVCSWSILWSVQKEHQMEDWSTLVKDPWNILEFCRFNFVATLSKWHEVGCSSMFRLIRWW